MTLTPARCGATSTGVETQPERRSRSALEVPESALADARAKHAISSSLRRPDGIALRLVAADAPSADAVPAEPDLEDAYLWMLEAQGAR